MQIAGAERLEPSDRINLTQESVDGFPKQRNCAKLITEERMTPENEMEELGSPLLSLALFRALPAPVVVARVDNGTIIWTNSYFCGLFGGSQQEIIGRQQLKNYFEPEAWQVLRHGLLQYSCPLSSGTAEDVSPSNQSHFLPNYELQLKGRDGQSFWGIVSLQLMNYQGQYLMIGVIQARPYLKTLGHALEKNQGSLSTITHPVPETSIEVHIAQLQTLTQHIGPPLDFNATLKLILSQIVETTGWSLGEAWLPNPVTRTLELSPAWHCQSQNSIDLKLFEIFHACTSEYLFEPAHGLPGQVWAAGGPVLWPDLALEPDCARARLAEQCGFKVGLGVPLLAGTETLGILIFFWQEEATNSLTKTGKHLSRFIEFLGSLTKQLGSLLQQQQAETALQTSETEQQALLAAMTDSIVVYDLDGRCLRVQIPQNAPVPMQPTTAQLNQTVYDFLPQPQADLHLRSIREVITTQKTLLDIEYNLTLKGEERWFSANISPLSTQTVIWVARDITERKHSEHSVRSYASELQALFAAMVDAILVFDESGRYLKIAPTNPQLLYKPASELLGKTLDEIFEPEQAREFLGYIQKALCTRETFNVEYCLTIDDRDVWFTATLSPTDENTVVWVARDITDWKESQEALRQAEAKYRSIFENALEGIFQTTPEGHYISANPALAKIYGYDSVGELLGQLVDIENQLYVNPHRRAEFIGLMRENDEVVGFESQIYRQDGSIIWISENARAVRDDQGHLMYYEGMVEDVTEQKKAKEQLHLQAFYDALTELPNRALFQSRLQSALERAKRTEGQYKFAVLFLDLDRFKVVNDSLGHLVGDRLLVAIARRLEQCVREGDTVARLGGDEFTILLENVEEMTTAIRVAERIETSLSSPFQLGSYQVHTGVSIGIVLSSEYTNKGQGKHQLSPRGRRKKNLQIPTFGLSYQKPEDLLRDADTALYRAKLLGKGRYELFDATMHQNAITLWQQETELRRAIEQSQFTLYYQPIIDLKTGKIGGVEALLRWHHPHQGLIYPEHFLPLAEETGLIVSLDRWVLQEACQQLQHWRNRNNTNAQPLYLHLNISQKQLLHPHFLDTLTQTCQTMGIEYQQLRLEITENLWSKHNPQIEERLTILKQQGLQLCIKNFALDYTCLSVLKESPISAFKIDRSFMDGIEREGDRAVMLELLLQFARHFGMTAIAEGIETEPQLDKICELGCELAQGYLFSKPLTGAAFGALLAKGKSFKKERIKLNAKNT